MKTLFLFCAIGFLISGNASAQANAYSLTKDAITRYLESNHQDLSMMAEDVVFINMATGERHTGKEEIRQMLHYVYHVAFDANAEMKNLIIEDNRAVLEADFVGKHIGEFAGIPATHKDVRVPLCVVYDVENGQITQGRIYFEVPAFMAQMK